MAIVTIGEFDRYLGTERTADIDLRQTALTAAERAIQSACNRAFAVAGAASNRSYVPRGDLVLFHDCTSVTSITENGTSVTASLYQLEPINALSWSGFTMPYNRARLLDRCWYSSGGEATIVVNAAWGWAAIPEEIEEAVRILAKDVVENKNVKFGIAAFTEYAAIRARENPQVKQLIDPYWRASWSVR